MTKWSCNSNQSIVPNLLVLWGTRLAGKPPAQYITTLCSQKETIRSRRRRTFFARPVSPMSRLRWPGAKLPAP